MPIKNDLDLGEPYKLRLEAEQEAKIEAIMAMTGETKPNVIRRLLRVGIELELTEQALGYVLPQIRRAVSEAMRPAEDRIATISAKAAVAAGTSMYTNLEVLGQLGRKDVRTIHTEARKKAVANLRSKEDKLSDADQE